MAEYSYSTHPYKKNPNGKAQSITVHRKIWMLKHGEIPEGYIVHHINGNKKDNRIENLSLVNRSEHTLLHPKRVTTQTEYIPL